MLEDTAPHGNRNVPIVKAFYAFAATKLRFVDSIKL